MGMDETTTEEKNMENLEQLHQAITEQTDALGIERELVEDYLAASDKARRMIGHTVFGLVFKGDLAAAYAKRDEFLNVLDKLRSAYRARLDLMAFVEELA